MAHNLTETATFDANITVPDSGDARTAASVVTPLQALADRTQFLNARVTMPGALLWNGAVRIPGGTDNNVYISPIQSVSIGGAVLNSVTELSADASGLSDSSWGYVYCYNSSGVLLAEVSSTAPDGAHTFKSGDNTRRYLCAVRRGTGANVPARYASRGRCIYLGGSTVVGNNTAANTYLAVPLTAYLPPHCTMALLNIEVQASTDAANGFVRKTGSGITGGLHVYAHGVASGTSQSYLGNIEVETNDSQSIDAFVDAAGGSPHIAVYCAGFVESV